MRQERVREIREQARLGEEALAEIMAMAEQKKREELAALRRGVDGDTLEAMARDCDITSQGGLTCWPAGDG